MRDFLLLRFLSLFALLPLLALPFLVLFLVLPFALITLLGGLASPRLLSLLRTLARRGREYEVEQKHRW